MIMYAENPKEYIVNKFSKVSGYKVDFLYVIYLQQKVTKWNLKSAHKYIVSWFVLGQLTFCNSLTGI